MVKKLDLTRHTAEGVWRISIWLPLYLHELDRITIWTQQTFSLDFLKILFANIHYTDGKIYQDFTDRFTSNFAHIFLTASCKIRTTLVHNSAMSSLEQFLLPKPDLAWALDGVIVWKRQVFTTVFSSPSLCWRPTSIICWWNCRFRTGVLRLRRVNVVGLLGWNEMKSFWNEMKSFERWWVWVEARRAIRM